MFLLSFKLPGGRVAYYGASHRPVSSPQHAMRFATPAAATHRYNTLTELAFGARVPRWNSAAWPFVVRCEPAICHESKAPRMPFRR